MRHEYPKRVRPALLLKIKSRSGGGIVKSPKNIAFCAALVFLLAVFVAPSGAAEPGNQIVANYADILKANPMKAGETAQAITLATDGTATVNLVRFAAGAEVKPHIHKVHSETVYIIEGSGKMMIEGKEIEVGPGSIIHVPMDTPHAVKCSTTGELIGIQVFAPEWTQPDRVPVP